MAEQIPFGDSIALARDPAYIGTLAKMEQYLRTTTAPFLREPSAASAEAASDAIATTLLGKNPAVKVVPDWHAEGAIDLVLVQMLEASVDSPLEAVKLFAISLCNELLDVWNYAQDEMVTPEQWQFQINEIYERYTRVALGVPGSDLSDVDEPDL